MRISAKNNYGDTASHILYRVKTQQEQGTQMIGYFLFG